MIVRRENGDPLKIATETVDAMIKVVVGVTLIEMIVVVKNAAAEKKAMKENPGDETQVELMVK